MANQISNSNENVNFNVEEYKLLSERLIFYKYWVLILKLK
jgi:hypothetical protein